MLIRKFKLVEPIFEHYKLFAVMKNGERWTVTEEDEFDRIYQGIDLHVITFLDDLNHLRVDIIWMVTSIALSRQERRRKFL